MNKNIIKTVNDVKQVYKDNKKDFFSDFYYKTIFNYCKKWGCLNKKSIEYCTQTITEEKFTNIKKYISDCKGMNNKQIIEYIKKYYSLYGYNDDVVIVEW